MSKHPMLRVAGLVVLLLLGAACDAPVRETAVRSDETRRESVILLHGLARTCRSMRRMQRELTRAGYTVHAFGYPSRSKTVEQIVEEHFVPFVARCQSNNPARIHFVSHSLGGILLRDYFVRHDVPNAGRIVMLGPPSRGSEVVDKLGDWAPFDWVNGPAGRQLGTDAHSLPNTLPAPPVAFGVIAGTRSINWILSCLIPGPDDGKVALDRVNLQGAADFATVKTAHPFLMSNRTAIELTVRFLQTGSFGNQPAEHAMPPTPADER